MGGERHEDHGGTAETTGEPAQEDVQVTLEASNREAVGEDAEQELARPAERRQCRVRCDLVAFHLEVVLVQRVTPARASS